VFCLPSFDSSSWSASWMPLTDRARNHRRYEDWIIWQVVPFIRDRCGGRDDIATAGPSLGAFHAILFALRHPHVFGRAVAFSGNYDPWSWRGWGPSDEETYFTCPLQFVPGLHGGHLDYLRSRLFLTLVVGSGMWEDTTGANYSTHLLAGALADKQIPHEFFVWGHEWPHDWSSWRAQAAVYLPALG
jgi:esterase/lipase superfamily enzyme